jgi:hypothetical protein
MTDPDPYYEYIDQLSDDLEQLEAGGFAHITSSTILEQYMNDINNILADTYGYMAIASDDDLEDDDFDDILAQFEIVIIRAENLKRTISLIWYRLNHRRRQNRV